MSGAPADDPALPRPAVDLLSVPVVGSELHAYLALLLSASAGGDERAFAELYDRTHTQMYRGILRVVKVADHASEVTQEFYLEVWRQAARFDVGRGTVLAWMTMMAQRRAIDRLRSLTSDTARDDRYARQSQPRPFDVVWGEVDRQLDHQRVRLALGLLTPLQREAVLLVYFGGCSGLQAATALEVPVATLKTRVRSGLARLRVVMAE